MPLNHILGYWVTDDPDVLAYFIDQVRACYSALEEKLAHIRQRQRVLEALRTLDQQAKKALIDGRTRLDQATSGQQALCAPRPADPQAQQIEKPVLRVVSQVEGEL